MGLELKQVPSVYHRGVGDTVLTTLSDGFLQVGVAALERVREDEARDLLHRDFRPEIHRTQVNVFAVRSGDRVALLDTGAGVQHMPNTVGQLRVSMEAAGIPEESVDTILLTHIHPDHTYGLVDGLNRPVFRNATIMMAVAEYEFWLEPESAADLPLKAQKYFQPIREAIAPYRDRIELFSGETELFPGLYSVPLPGHTPGHTGYRVDSGGESLLIWGDIVHVPSVQLARPEAGIAFDVDGPLAAETRRKLLDQVATDRTMVAGMHLDFPAFGHIERRGEGYGFVPEPWRNFI